MENTRSTRRSAGSFQIIILYASDRRRIRSFLLYAVGEQPTIRGWPAWRLGLTWPRIEAAIIENDVVVTRHQAKKIQGRLYDPGPFVHLA